MKNFKDTFTKLISGFLKVISKLNNYIKVKLWIVVVVVIGFLISFLILSKYLQNNDLKKLKTLNTRLEKTSDNIHEETMGLYVKINSACMAQPNTYITIWDKAHFVENKTHQIIEYIEVLKTEILARNKEKSISTKTNEKSKFNVYGNSEISLNNNEKKFWNDLLVRTDNYRDSLLYCIYSLHNNKYTFNFIYNTLSYNIRDYNTGNKWGIRTSGKISTWVTICMLSDFQTDIRIVENNLIGFLLNSQTENDIKIHNLNALVIPENKFVKLGEQYRATISMIAIDTSMRTQYWVSNEYPYYDSVLVKGSWEYRKKDGLLYDTLSINNNGQGIYSTKKPVGTYTYGGVIEYHSNIGTFWLPFKSTYTIRNQ